MVDAPAIPFNRPSFGPAAMDHLTAVMRSGQTSGDRAVSRRCEALLAEITGSARVFLTPSCTGALEMSALLLDVGPGDEVIVPSFTFTSSANAFVLLGARPVFVDSRPDTLNLDASKLDALVTARTRAVVVMHYAGVGCEMDAVTELARRRGIAVVEDNAHGLMGSLDGKALGSFGVMSTVSFHETKNLACGEGGALFLNDPALVARAEMVREKGTNRERAAGLVMLWVIGMVVVRLARGVVLLDRPITDDEHSVRFGAQVLLTGQCMAPSPGPTEIFPQLFLFTRGGRVASFDFLGPQLVWVAEFGGHLNGLLIAALGALPLPALAYAVGRRRTAAWGLAAALLFVASPTGALFSITSHANTFSRGLIALSAALAVWAAGSPSLARWAAAGLSLGAAGLCRPAEVFLLSAPLAVMAVVRAARGSRDDRTALAGLLLGVLPWFALFALHNRCVTGHALLHARFAPSELVHNWNHPPTTRLQNFGGNFAYNVLLLGVWFLGPLGLPLVALGAGRDKVLAGVAAGVALGLALAILHPDPGIHLIGPIHYADSTVALALLAVAGLARLADSRYARLVDRPRAVATLAVAVGLAGAVLAGWTAATLQKHAVAEEVLAAQLSPERLGRAVVLVPPRRWILEGTPGLPGVPFLRAVGSHERAWPPNDPALSDPVLLLHDLPGAEDVARRRFPERRLLRLQLIDRPPWMRIVQVPAGPTVSPKRR